jgi:hypothetical protein
MVGRERAVVALGGLYDADATDCPATPLQGLLFASPTGPGRRVLVAPKYAALPIGIRPRTRTPPRRGDSIAPGHEPSVAGGPSVGRRSCLGAGVHLPQGFQRRPHRVLVQSRIRSARVLSAREIQSHVGYRTSSNDSVHGEG